MRETTLASTIPTRPETLRAGKTSIVARALRAPALWLTVIVGLSAAVRGAIAVGVPSPWILPDEIVYSELAKSIAAGGFPSVRGVHELGWGVVYQALIAPAWVAFSDPTRAYHAALAINALVMSLAAVPSYFLARMFVGRPGSIVVAGMTVLVPSMAYTGVLMTENACYPAFVLAVLLIARAVRTPSKTNQALALVGLGIVALTRIQAMALVGAYLVAVVLYAWVGPRSERRPYLKRFVPTVAVSLLASFAPMTASIARGDGATGWLGSRSGTFDEMHPHEIPQWFVFLVADLVLYVAVAPVAATVVMLGRGLSRRAPEPARLFAAVALPTLVAMLLSVSFVSASLDVDGTENLNERYVFYVVPLLFVGLALWVRERLPRPRPWAWVIVGLCCLLPAFLPIHRLGFNANFQSMALLPWLRIHASHGAVAAFVVAFTLACGVLWIAVKRDRTGYLWIVTGLSMVVIGMAAVSSFAGSASNSATAFGGGQANWVDRAVPEGARVAILWRQGPETRAVRAEIWLMVTEFFNRSVGDVYRIGRPTYYEAFLPTERIAEGPDGTLVRDGKPLEARFVLVACEAPVVGTVVANAPHGSLQLVRADGPLRLAPPRPCEARSRGSG